MRSSPPSEPVTTAWAGASPAPQRTFYLLGSFALLVALLYWGRPILIPVVLAVLLAFLLTPLVEQFERRGVGRTPAVLLVVFVTVALLGGVVLLLTSQLTELISQLPAHKGKMQQKIADLRGAGKAGPLATVQDFLQEAEQAGRPGDKDPAPVVRVRAEKQSLSADLSGAVSTFVGPLSSAFAVLVLVMCMLMQREDLRNRIVRLAGRGRVSLTTRALDEVGWRIGRYLLWRSLVNFGFAVAVGFGLALIGVPYPALWGFLAGALRFLPSVGVWLVAPFPFLFALLDAPGWTPPTLVLLLFLTLEFLTGSVVEPWVCGPTVGVAAVPLFVAVLFWSWLWGLTGLLLATPLTVCLAVLGRHIPQLESLGVLLGSRPALDAATRYFQRLLARDRREAAHVAEEYRAEHPLAAVYDQVLVRALYQVKRGRAGGELLEEDEQLILGDTRQLVEAMRAREPGTPGSDDAPLGDDERAGRARVKILGCPANDPLDELALLMFQHLMAASGWEMQLTGTETFAAQVASLIGQEEPALIVVAALAPGGLPQLLYLCRRLRSRFPHVKIVVGRWGLRGRAEPTRNRLLAAGADRATTTLSEALDQVTQAAGSLAADV